MLAYSTGKGKLMKIQQPIAVLSLAIVFGLSGAQFASAHDHGHIGEHHGSIDHHHQDREISKTSIQLDGKGGAYHVDGDKLRHCLPTGGDLDSVEHSLSCTEWK